MDGLDRIYQRIRQQITQGSSFFADGKVIDLLAEPGFAQMSFMKRRARAVEVTLENVKVRLFPDDLLAGTFLETWVRLIQTTLDERLRYADMGFGYPARNNRYVDGKAIYSSSPLHMTKDALLDPESGNFWWGHSCSGIRRILEMGYEGIAQDAERRIAEMYASGDVDPDKIEFWEAVCTCVRAVCKLSRRYADALDAEALSADETRAAELRQMAQNMRRVPAQPAETFWEAVQCIWMVQMVGCRFNGIDIGRMDQYLYPYYQRDLEKGILTPEQAEELVGNFFLKCYERYAAQPSNAGLHPAIMLGGLNADGKDGTNAVTFMCLRATERFSTPTPKVSVRINEQTPDEIFQIAHRMLLKGINQPDFYADRVILPAYERLGVPLEDAVEYAQSVCEEISLAGLSEDCNNDGPHCDVHDKVQRAMGRVAAGEKADTFEDFLAIVEEEIRACLLEKMAYHIEQTQKLAAYHPLPLHSAAIVGCLESGKDVLAGGAKYSHTGSVIGGLATAADGLYAINRLVYEEKRLTIPEFYQILLDDYQGNELLRLEILNKFPKFGNDIPQVDALAARLFDVFADELEKHSNNRGGKYKVSAWASEYRSSYMATPDGRKQGDTFAVNISPTPGRDTKGVTAVLRSGTKVNMRICTGGAMLDVAMHPSCIRGEHGPMILKQIVTAYGQMGGGGLQFNVMDADVLRQAQENPAQYRNLMVRVWGYNDYFVALPKHKQEHVIARTIHGSV